MPLDDEDDDVSPDELDELDEDVMPELPDELAELDELDELDVLLPVVPVLVSSEHAPSANSAHVVTKTAPTPTPRLSFIRPSPFRAYVVARLIRSFFILSGPLDKHEHLRIARLAFARWATPSQCTAT